MNMKCRVLDCDTVSQRAGEEGQRASGQVHSVIFLVHESDEWCVHGPSVTGAALPLLRSAPQPF